MGIWYCTREDVKSALDIKETARNNSQVDRAIEAASRSVEKLCHRKFYPWTGTRYFRWPSEPRSAGWRLWLGQDELISLTSITSGEVAVDTDDVFLEPINSGPPYDRIELDLGASVSFGLGSTPQRDVAVTGVFGYSADFTGVGTAEIVANEGVTSITVSDGSALGVGDLVRLESERLLVTGRSWTAVGNTTDAVDAEKGSVRVEVVDGTDYNVGEVILVDSERMLIVDIVGNNLIVKRAWDGSVLASHTSITTVYVSRVLTVERGVTGTQASGHPSVTAYKHLVPGPVKSLTIAEAINQLQQEGAGYARVVASGEAARELIGRAIKDLRKDVYESYGRRARVGAV